MRGHSPKEHIFFLFVMATIGKSLDKIGDSYEEVRLHGATLFQALDGTFQRV